MTVLGVAVIGLTVIDLTVIGLTLEWIKARHHKDYNKVNDYLKISPKLEVHEERFYARIQRGTGKSVCANPFFYCAINKFHKVIRFIIKTSSAAIIKMSPAGWQQPGGAYPSNSVRFPDRFNL